MAGPMEGINVVELGVWVAGPATGGILADWGADVIKIEPPTGDPARLFGRMLGLDVDVSPPFEMDNRSKRSVVIDPRTERRLRDRARGNQRRRRVRDERPALARCGGLGLDFESLAAGPSPELVYGLITGYGETGPDADRAAYDIAAFWARGGLAHLLTRPGDTPPFQRGGMGDHMAGMTLAAAICAALVARDRTGTGQLVSTSLYRQGAYTVSFDLNTYLMAGQPIAVIRTTGVHGQPVHEQLHRRRPATVLDRRPRSRAPLAGRCAGAVGRADWSVRSAVLLRAVTRRQRRSN